MIMSSAERFGQNLPTAMAAPKSSTPLGLISKTLCEELLSHATMTLPWEVFPPVEVMMSIDLLGLM